jgi:hypothetical protein
MYSLPWAGNRFIFSGGDGTDKALAIYCSVSTQSSSGETKPDRTRLTKDFLIG